jgi:hypothetical protein
MLQARPRLLLVAYALVLGVEAGGNVWINFIGKGRAWDLYPLAQAFWVACSVVAVIGVARRPSGRRLAGVVIALMFLDSWVDLCAMGHACWWAGTPVLVEWEWDALRARGQIYHYLYAYWAVTWGMQVPLRCFMIAWVLSGSSWRRFAFIATGLNLIWLTAPQDVLYYFVWLGLYDAAHPYFDYLPPEGTWNLWNMLLLRVPIGVAAGSLLVWAGMRRRPVAGNSTPDPVQLAADRPAG